MTSDPTLARLKGLVGTWTTEATHPAMPGVVVHGTANIEWLEGERFLILRARNDHPDFPDSISIIGFTERDRAAPGARSVPAPEGEHPLTMHYYDSRGVFRDYQTGIDDSVWRYQLLAPGFSQRFTGKLVDAGNTIDGTSQLCEDDRTWRDDLKITYRRDT
jgi:hypothetical protein